MIEEVKVILTKSDAEAFKLFQKNYSNFVFLLEHGAFVEQAGNVSFNRDVHGIIQTVAVTNDFKRKKILQLSTGE